MHPLPLAVDLGQDAGDAVGHLKVLSVLRLAPEVLDHGRVAGGGAGREDLEVLEAHLGVGEVAKGALKVSGEGAAAGEAEEVVGDDVVELVVALARADVLDERGVEDAGPALVELEDLPLFLEEVGVVVLWWIRGDRGRER